MMNVQIKTMLLISPSFENNGMIPKKFARDGGNINPELRIENVPVSAKSLALIMHDSDAPMLGGFTHWVVWNIVPTTALVKEESAPPGAVEGRNTRGTGGYTGPYPPPGHGIHHYEFYLYALDATLDLPVASSKAELEVAMQGRIIEETKLVGLYERNS